MAKRCLRFPYRENFCIWCGVVCVRACTCLRVYKTYLYTTDEYQHMGCCITWCLYFTKYLLKSYVTSGSSDGVHRVVSFHVKHFRFDI